MSEGLGEHLRRNTRVTMATWFVGQGLNFLRMLILIRFLDTSDYGLWIFSFSIIGYFTLYSFGISQSFVKYTADYLSRKDYQGLSHMLSTGFVINLAMGIGVTGVLLLFTDNAVAFFNIQAENVADARFVILGVGLTSAFNMAFGGYEPILIGLHRIDLKNYSRVATMIVEFVLTVAALSMGFGLRAVVTLYALGTIAAIGLFAWHVYRLAPGLRVNPLFARMHCVPSMLFLGGRMQVLGIVALIVSSADIVVYMKYATAAFVGLYGAAQRFAQRAQGLALQGFGALAPASADLVARGAFEELGDVYRTAQRFTAVGCAWIFAFLAVNHDLVMLFVLGNKFDPIGSLALLFLSIGYFVHTLTGPGSSMLRGAGKPEREIVYQLLTLVLFLGCFFPALAHGDERILVATWPLSLATASLVFIVLANRFFQVPFHAPFGDVWAPVLAAPVLAYSVRWLAETSPLPMPERDFTALALIMVLGTVYSLLFFVAAWKFPGLTPEDKARILRFLPKGERMAAKLGLDPNAKPLGR